MDLSTILGLVVGFGSMIIAIIVEGHGDVTELVPFFTNISAWIIILGGTFGATMLSVRPSDLRRIPLVVGMLMKEEKYDYIELINVLTMLAEKARREGLISLETSLAEIEDPFLKKGLQLVIDGTDPEMIESILMTKIAQQKNESAGDAAIFETMGGFSPTMGIVGTVMGLVGALKRMGEAGMDATVSALAVAFIATFWGIGLANLLFLPLCGKLRARWRDKMIASQIIIEGIMGIQAGNNPRIVRERLASFLSIEEAEDVLAEQAAA